MKYKLLFVDDDENILAGYRRHLRKDFEVYTADSGKKALDILTKKGPFHVAVSDLKMPGMDGFEFFSQLHLESPETICIMLTGYAELQASLKAFNKGYIFRFLTKPCKIQLLEKTINQAIEKYFENVNLKKETSESEKKESLKRVLIIDDDEEELTLVSSALNSRLKIEALTAENEEIAEKLLNSLKINLVIVSSTIAVDNNSAFLEKLKESYPDINTGITAWYASQDLKKSLQRFNIGSYFQKPLDPNTFPDLVEEEFYSGPKGIIDGISIGTFLQMIEMEDKTCTLQISQDDKQGKIYFRKGSVIDASYEDKNGIEAAYAIINWEKAEIEIENYCHKNERVINNSLMGILMEAAKIKDHEANLD